MPVLALGPDFRQDDGWFSGWPSWLTRDAWQCKPPGTARDIGETSGRRWARTAMVLRSFVDLGHKRRSPTFVTMTTTAKKTAGSRRRGKTIRVKTATGSSGSTRHGSQCGDGANAHIGPADTRTGPPIAADQTFRASARFSFACADALIWHTRAAPMSKTAPISSRFISST